MDALLELLISALFKTLFLGRLERIDPFDLLCDVGRSELDFSGARVDDDAERVVWNQHNGSYFQMYLSLDSGSLMVAVNENVIIKDEVPVLPALKNVDPLFQISLHYLLLITT